VFTRAEAMAEGVPTARLRRADLRILRRGLYARAGAPISELDIAAAICRTDPDAVVVGLSAARARAMPLPLTLSKWSPLRPVRMAVPGGRRGSDRVVRWHDFVLSPEHVDTPRWRLPPEASGAPLPLVRLRLSTRARTWRDLAPHLDHAALVAVADHLLRRPRPKLESGRTDPWCTPDQLRALCTGRHAAALRRALDQARIGADSPRETRLRLAFLRAGLPEPELNVPLIGDDGIARHEPDFLWPRYRVCAEYEGKQHNDDHQVERDIRRARRVQEAGWVEIRLYDRDTDRDCAEAIRLVRQELTTRGWRRGEPVEPAQPRVTVGGSRREAGAAIDPVGGAAMRSP
jgi:hypothetical protein